MDKPIPPSDPNPRPEDPPHEVEEEEEEPQSRPSRTPFTNLSQVDRDLALARTLQEQERAYMMLRMGAGRHAGSDSGSDYEVEELSETAGSDGGRAGEPEGSAEDSDYEDEDDVDGVEDDEGDAFDEINYAGYVDDEAYARALQEAEEREVAARLMALSGINDWVTEEREDHENNSQETWQDVDPDDFSYEELIALGEAVGTESRGLSDAAIALLPSVCYKAQSSQDEHTEQCVICRLDYEDGDCLVVLPCKHTYHSECIEKWLQINKVCPVCSAEVSTS